MWDIKKASEHDYAPPEGFTWPWCKMAPGDLTTVSDKTLVRRAQNSCHNYGNKKGWKFRTKTVNDVLFVWRIS